MGSFFWQSSSNKVPFTEKQLFKTDETEMQPGGLTVVYLIWLFPQKITHTHTHTPTYTTNSKKHACTHGRLLTLWSMHTHTHTHTSTNVHTQTQTLMQQNSNNWSSALMIITVAVVWMPGESVCGLQMRGEVGPQWGGIMPDTDTQRKSFLKVCHDAAGRRHRGLRQEHQTMESNRPRQQVAAPLLSNSGPLAVNF